MGEKLKQDHYRVKTGSQPEENQYLQGRGAHLHGRADHPDGVQRGPRAGEGRDQLGLGCHPVRLGVDEGPVHVPQDGGWQLEHAPMVRSGPTSPAIDRSKARMGAITCSPSSTGPL